MKLDLRKLFPENVRYVNEVYDDLSKLDNSELKQVLRGIAKVAENPKSFSEGGYGFPLGNKNGNNLSGLMKIKFLRLGIRCVYKYISDKNYMKVIVVDVRKNDKVYKVAAKRRVKYNL